MLLHIKGKKNHMAYLGRSPRFTRVRNTASTALTIQTDDSNSITVSPNKSAQITVNVAASTSSDVVFNGTGAITLPSGTTSQEPSSPVAGMLRYNSTLSLIEVYQGSAWRSLADISTAQALTNKDYQGGTASNSSRVTIPKDTASNIAGLTRKQATLIYDTTNNLVNFDNGTTLNALASTAAATTTIAGITIKYPIGTVAANDSAVVFDNTYDRFQSCLPTAARTYTLPTTSISAGDAWDFDNQSLFLITVNSSGGNLVGYVYPKASTRFVPLVNTPTTAANWNVIYTSIIPAIVQANDASTTFTFLDNQFQSSAPTAARTYTLATTGLPAGYIFELYNRSSTDANYITIQSSGSNTITILPALGYVKLQVNTATPTTASHWTILQRESQWVTYTPTLLGMGTVSNNVAYRRIQGDYLFVKGFFTTGTPTAVLATIPVSAGLTISSAKSPISNNTGNSGPICGYFAFQNAASSSGPLITATATSTTNIYWSTGWDGVNCLTPSNGSSVINASKDGSYQFEVPLV